MASLSRHNDKTWMLLFFDQPSIHQAPRITKFDTRRIMTSTRKLLGLDVRIAGTPEQTRVPVGGSPLIHISPPHSSWTPGVFYTYFYNYAHRLRLEKLL